MCTCASCSYTDGFHSKGFAAWPRGEPAGKRASEAAYAAHVRAAWAGAYKTVGFTPGQAPRFRITGTPYAPPTLKIPGYSEETETLAGYIAEFDKLNGLKRPGPVKAPARPATPAKAPRHFPELDRQPEAATIYDMRKAKAKRSVGRPPLPGRRVVIKLEERQIKAAEKLGGGNVAAGIRKALEAA